MNKIINTMGYSIIWRSFQMLIIFGLLFSYIKIDGNHSLFLWIICITAIYDALWSAIKLSEAGY